jgi:hypothetical protein
MPLRQSTTPLRQSTTPRQLTTLGHARSRSTDKRRNGKNPFESRVLEEQHHSLSIGDMKTFRAILQVKSQYESLQTPGLARSNSPQRGEFGFLEVREFPTNL